MITLLLIAAAAAPTAVDAERAFAADAQRRGQWTAFRATATEDAVMFVPGPVNAQAFLKDKADPPQPLKWWPAKSFVSCDGNVAVNHGPWTNPNNGTGTFTTVWERRAEGWRWVYDGGDAVKAARPKKPLVRKASCTGRPNRAMTLPPPPTAAGQEVKERSGSSEDGTLAWSWTVDVQNTRRFAAWLWNGRRFEQVLNQTVPG
jgi:hypothetical protein